MAIAKAKEATGTAIKDNIRKITQGRRQEGRQRGRRPEGDRRRQGDRLRRRVGPVRLRRQGRHPRLQVPLRADQGRQVHVGEDRLKRLLVIEVLQLSSTALVSGTLLAVPAIGFTAMFAVLRFSEFLGRRRTPRSAPSRATSPTAPACRSWARWPCLRGGGRGRPADRRGRRTCRWCKQARSPAAIASIALTSCWRTSCGFVFGNELARLRPADRARLALRRHPRRPAAARDHAHRARDHAGGVRRLTPSPASARRCARRPTIPSWPRSRASTPTRMALMASFVGMGLVGVGGMLLGLDSSIDPLTGTRILLDLRRRRAGRARQRAGRGARRLPDRHRPRSCRCWSCRSTYRAAVGFLAILIVLTLRPRGLLGEQGLSERLHGTATCVAMRATHRAGASTGCWRSAST